MILVAAVFLCGILYLALGPARMSSGADADSETKLIAGRSSGEVTQKESESGDGNDTGSGSGAAAGVDLRNQGGSPDAGSIYVYICGAVKKPGVYTFEKNPRVVEVVDRAGGFTKKADAVSVNLAGVCEDGAQVVIGEKGKAGEALGSGVVSGGTGIVGAVSGDSTSGTDGRIDINTAGAEELTQIPGIGEAKSAAIVSYRDEHGRFQKPEDLMQIPGIKEGIFNRIKDYIRV